MVLAFGPRLESLKGGYGSRMSRTAMADYDEREREQERESQTHRRRYSPYHDDLRIHNDLDFFHGSLLYAGNFRVDSTMFGIDNPFDLLPASADNNLLDICNGEDCEECSIPEEYKQVENPIDILMYLGIQRAEPIIATKVDK